MRAGLDYWGELRIVIRNLFLPVFLFGFGLPLLLVGQNAHAHSSSNSFILISQTLDALTLRIDLPLRDLDLRFNFDRNRDDRIQWNEIRKSDNALEMWVRGGLSITPANDDQAPCAIGRFDTAIATYPDGNYLSIQAPLTCGELNTTPLIIPLSVRYQLLFDQDDLHRAIVRFRVITSDLEIERSAVLSPSQTSQTLKPGSSSVMATLKNYGMEGIWHIWIGIDHILFLLCLLLPCVFSRSETPIGHWRPIGRYWPAVVSILAIVTAFTVAHSITLGLAAFKFLTPPAALIEPIIAASVVVAALSNLTKKFIHFHWQLAFIFGLIHGFGFANVLSDLGLPSDQIAVALFGFNVGVEFGQIAIVMAFFPIAWTLRATWFYRWVVVVSGSLAISAVAILWIFDRI
jgi:hypothetical protein